MRYAIFSDVHANRQALAAVLRDMRKCGAEVLVCLGDVIGYGPCPQIVLDAVRKNTANLVLGNHDAAACGRLDANLFNDHAREVIEWTRAQMNEDSLSFLNDVAMTMVAEDILFVHAEPEMPGRFDYIEDAAMAGQQFKATEQRITFVGHTHHPTVWVTGSDGAVRQLPDQDQQFKDGNRYIVNVGSVGEPRNPEDIRARYVIYDSEKKNLFFRRVEFDIAGYRKDLQVTGLKIEPFFLTVDDGSAKGEVPAEVQRDMRKVVNISPAAYNAKPKKLVLPGAEEEGEAPISTVKLKVANESEAPKAKTLATVAPASGAAPASKALTIPDKPVAALKSGAIATGGANANAKTATGDPAAAGEAPESAMAQFVAERKKKRFIIHIICWVGVVALCGFAAFKLIELYGPVGGIPLGASRTPVGKRLVTYWNMDITLDPVAGSHRVSGSSDGMAGFGHNGQFNKCLKLDGTFETNFGKPGEYEIGLSSMTASVWFRFDSTSRGAGGYLFWTGETDGWSLRGEALNLVATINNVGEPTVIKSKAVPTIKDGAWHNAFVVFDRDANEARLFVDGELVGSGAIPSNSLKSDDQLTIGGGENNETMDFPGALDDVAIWARAFAADEIAEFYLLSKDGDSLGALIKK